MCKGGFSVTLLLSVLASFAAAADVDSDADGLTDFQEVHKYCTDPGRADSDSDGVADGDWHERREYAYTIRSVVKVMPPCNTAVVNDDYQDARVLSETEEYVELEVIHYPFNTNANTIAASQDWRKSTAAMKPYLQPGITTNWDEELQKDLIAALEEDGIHVERLTDKQIVEQASRWLLERAKYYPMFGTFFVHFPDGKVEIFPGLEERFEGENSKTQWPVPEHFQHELFGKGMFYCRSRGSCTSTAVYLTTCLRALGIPTRMIVGIPVVDASDPAQVRMVEEHISHHEVRQTLLSALAGMGNSFSAHTFNEVFVGGRWHRLNSNKLGQNSYGDGAMGLLTHVHTFNDLSEANLTATWGLRYGRGDRDEVFRHSNPYRATEISDRFGLHCDLPNPPVEEIKEVRITKAYWFFSPDRPEWIREDYVRKNGDGHVLAHAEASFKDLRVVYPKLDKAFLLRAQGQPPVALKAERGYWNSECYLRVPEEQYARMKPGIPYQLEPVATEDEYRWVVEPGVVLVKGDQPPPVADEAPKPDEGESTRASQDDEKRFPHVLDFRLGKRKFAEGDDIVITEIRGTRPRFEIGGRYLVRGRYTLGSQQSAVLCLYRTTKKRVSVPGNKNQTMQVEKGSGTFALEKVIHHEGYLHLSFYPSGGGGGLGGVYFGQNDQDTLTGQ